MKKIIVFILIVFSAGVKAQTVIPRTLTVDSLSKMPKGSYQFYRINKDTVDMIKDTIPKCPKQRTVRSFKTNSFTRKTTFTYDDGSSSTL